MNYRLIKQYPGSPPLGEEWDENTEVKTLTSSTLEEYQSTGIKIKDLPEYWQPVEFTLPEKYKVMRTLENYNIINNYVRDLFKKKYKIIKEFPGSPKLGTILTHEELQFCNWNEYYQEIVEKDYEILSLRSLDIIEDLENNETINMLLKQGCSIYSVKRLSDGEIFTVGDNFYPNEYCQSVHSFRTIHTLDLLNDKISINKEASFLYHIIKCIKPILITEDGVNIFKGDEHYAVNIINFDLIKTKRNTLPKDNDKRFSTKEKAEEYIIENKPCLSFNDVAKIFVSTKYTTKNGKLYPQGQKLKELVKQKIKQ